METSEQHEKSSDKKRKKDKKKEKKLQKELEHDSDSKREKKEKKQKNKKKKEKKLSKIVAESEAPAPETEGELPASPAQPRDASAVSEITPPEADSSVPAPRSRFVYSYRVPEHFSFGKTHLTKSFDRSLTMFRATLDLFNVPYKATEADIEQLFAAFAPVQARLHRDEASGEPTGRAEVQLERSRAADAVQQLNRSTFLGRVLSVALRPADG